MSRKSFEPRVGIVTGGGAGIGLEIARQLVERGSHVVIADIDGAAAEEAATTLGSASAATVDVSDPEAVRELVRATVAEHGRLDVMVNNAGVLFSGPFEETTDAHWEHALGVNVRGVVNGARAAYDQMLTQPDGGYILNTASLAGLMPAPWMTPYTTSKWAVVGFSRALRAEAAGRRITVTALCPGYTDTKLLDEVVDPSASVRPGDFRKTAKGFQGRLMTPRQVAEKAVEGLAAGKAVVVVGWFAQVMYRANRINPRTMDLGVRVEAAKQRRSARTRR